MDPSLSTKSSQSAGGGAFFEVTSESLKKSRMNVEVEVGEGKEFGAAVFDLKGGVEDEEEGEEEEEKDYDNKEEEEESEREREKKRKEEREEVVVDMRGKEKKRFLFFFLFSLFLLLAPVWRR